MSEQKLRGNIILSLEKGEYAPYRVIGLLQDSQIFSIFNAVNVTLNSPLLDGVNKGILIRDASTSPYERGYNPTLDIMLDSIGLKVVKIVDNQGNNLIELDRS